MSLVSVLCAMTGECCSTVRSWCSTSDQSSLVELSFGVNTLFSVFESLWKDFSKKVIEKLQKRAINLKEHLGSNITEVEVNDLWTRLFEIINTFHNTFDSIFKYFRIFGLSFAVICVFVLWSGTLTKIQYWSLILICPFPIAVLRVWQVHLTAVAAFDTICEELEKKKNKADEKDMSLDVAAEVDKVLQCLKSPVEIKSTSTTGIKRTKGRK